MDRCIEMLVECNSKTIIYKVINFIQGENIDYKMMGLGGDTSWGL